MTLFQLLSRNIQRLQLAGFSEAALDVSLIAAHVLHMERGQLGTRYEKKLNLWQRVRIYNLVSQRLRHKPIAYILGYRDFYRDRFQVSARSLIPRPDSEHILYILEEFNKKGLTAVQNILDLGTGTGALGLSARHIYPQAHIDVLDIDTRLVRQNIMKLDARNIGVIQADMLSWDNPQSTQYDIILANPPYLDDADMDRLAPEVKDFEPSRALYAGQDGMLFYRDIASRAFNWMRQGGILLLEVDHKWKMIQKLFSNKHWEILGVTKDYAGLERVLMVKNTDGE